MSVAAAQTRRTFQPAGAITLPIILLLAAAVRLVAVYFIEGFVHDGTGRVSDTADWLEMGKPFLGRTLWPEGNYLLPAVGLAIWNDQYWTPRALYLLVGLSNIWALHRVTEAIFDRTAA